MTRILIADDHAVVRTGVRRILEDHPNWSVVAEAADGKDAIAKAIATKPDVAIVDHSLPLIDGIEVTRQIRQRVPSVEVLIFTMHDNENLLRDMVKAGARGYVLKSDAQQHLISAVQVAGGPQALLRQPGLRGSAGNIAHGCATVRSASDQPGAHYRSVGRRGPQQQADRALLNISVKTVETHRASIMRKLDLTSMAALVRYAVRNNLVEA